MAVLYKQYRLQLFAFDYAYVNISDYVLKHIAGHLTSDATRERSKLGLTFFYYDNVPRIHTVVRFEEHLDVTILFLSCNIGPRELSSATVCLVCNLHIQN